MEGECCVRCYHFYKPYNYMDGYGQCTRFPSKRNKRYTQWCGEFINLIWYYSRIPTEYYFLKEFENQIPSYTIVYEGTIKYDKAPEVLLDSSGRIYLEDTVERFTASSEFVETSE